MEFVQVNGTDLNASRIALGTWSISGFMWGGTDEQDAVATIRRALDSGINLIDTAPSYGWGRAEELVGRLLQEWRKRDEIIIATKCGIERQGETGMKRNSSRDYILKEVDESLNRLRTNYIDIYQVHWPDEDTPFEETAETLALLKKQGKILAIGVSNYSVRQTERFRKVTPVHTTQLPYNLFERAADRDVVPYAQQHKITPLLYEPLCRGLLSGRMTPDTKFHGDDIRQTDPRFQPPRFGQYLKAVDVLNRFARENYGKTVIQLALRWVLDRITPGVALWGARRAEQLDPLNGVWNWQLDASAMKAIDELLRNTIPEEHQPKSQVA